MKKIPLTQGLFSMVDDADYEHLSRYKWYALKDNHTYYAVRNIYPPNFKQIKMKMHRVILNCPEGLQVDHIDGNGLNNQRKNIRVVTCRQNHQNLHNSRYSKYPGVSPSATRGTWRALIKISGKMRFLGTYENELAAFQAYSKAVKDLGETVLQGEAI